MWAEIFFKLISPRELTGVSSDFFFFFCSNSDFIQSIISSDLQLAFV